MRSTFYKVLFALLVFVMPLQAQRVDGLRAGIQKSAQVAPMAPIAQPASIAAEGVSRKKLGIGAGVGAIVGAVVGGAIVDNSKFRQNEAWPLFVGGGALI